MPAPHAPMVDVAFALVGDTLPADHGRALADALLVALPWLAGTANAGVHPIRLADGSGPHGWLSKRSRLTLRVPRTLAASAARLEGARLDVAGRPLTLAGAPSVRELVPHATLYAPRVAADGDDELAFVAAVDAELERLGVACRRLCGRLQHFAGGSGPHAGFGLMLDGLDAGDALRVLERGLGAHRLWGCGLFVPHKSAAAVGA